MNEESSKACIKAVKEDKEGGSAFLSLSREGVSDGGMASSCTKETQVLFTAFSALAMRHMLENDVNPFKAFDLLKRAFLFGTSQEVNSFLNEKRKGNNNGNGHGKLHQL